MLYLWIKVLHILAIVAWMAGLFYLPRLFVYHAGSAVGSETDLVFRIMERRLVSAIMRPAAVVAVLAGALLAYEEHWGLSDIWLVAKLAGVLGLVIYHGALERYQKLFATGWRGRSDRFFRVINELPTLLLIWIVIWVVVKPFS